MWQTAFTLAATPPFDFGKTLAFLRRFRASAIDRTFEGQALVQAVPVGSGVALARLQQAGTTEAPRLDGCLVSDVPLSPASVDGAKGHLAYFLGTDTDLGSFYREAERDDAFRPVLEKFYGLHPVRYTAPFECACWALVTQRTPNGFAYETMGRLIAAFGREFAWEGRRYRTFPEPLELLGFEPAGSAAARAKILEATNNVRKTGRLLAVAKAFASSNQDFLLGAPYGEVHRWLTSVPGLGTWSADYIMLRGLGRAERLPWSDTGLVEAVSKVYAGGLALSRPDVTNLAATYGPQQGIWFHYLKLYL